MITGVLLAAGRGARFGGAKLLAAGDDGVPIGVAAARHLLAAVERAVAVVRADDPRLAELLAGEGLQIVVNTDPGRGMASSLACGIRAAGPGAGWIVALADMPRVRAETVAAVAARLRAGAPVAAPCYRGRRGHPVGFGRDLWEELLALQGDRGARALLERHLNPGDCIHVDDAGVLLDVDTRADLQALAALAAVV